MSWYHRWTARLLEQFPALQEWLTAQSAGNLSVGGRLGTSFQEVGVDPFDSTIMLVTTGGVHTPDQHPFDMSDSRGDTSFRLIPREQSKFIITHDYFNHDDADRDINCLFPLPLVRGLVAEDLIGSLHSKHASFMGHIEDPLLPEFIEVSLPELWEQLDSRPDLILLSPG